MLESPGMPASAAVPINLFLASKSPRRRELLALCGWKYQVLPVDVDETPLHGEAGIDYVRRIAHQKALLGADEAGENSTVIAADTAVINRSISGEGGILGKPADQQEATKMLLSLRGHTHQVHTAVSILSTKDGSILSDMCTTDVPMRGYTDEEIAEYVAGGDPMDKAGAYAIQHAGFHPVDGLEGCYANVMGLPLCHITRTLAKLGILPPVNVPQACQAALGYNCPVYREILA